MFGGLIDDFKVRLDLTLKSVVAGAIFAFAGMAAFICGLVILFLWMLQTYGAMHAWGAIAGVFGLIALLAVIPLIAAGRKRRALAHAAALRAERAEAQEHKAPEWWQNPAMLLTGLQAARAIGVRRLLPILAIGAVVGGVLISKQLGEAEKQPDLQPAE